MSAPKVTWLGHAGFKIEADGKVIYIDTWLGNPFCPAELKAATPTDADLLLVTHGHFDHSVDAPVLLKASTKPGCAILSIYEIGQYYETVHGVAKEQLMAVNKSGTRDLGWCRVTMVSADHSSSCGMHQGNIFDGGAAAGFVIRFPAYPAVSIYHAGDTGIFLDMQLINELYQPSHLMLPIGGNFTMGPEEAAHACKFFTHARVVIPMHFGTFPLLPGTYPDFVAWLAKKDVTHLKALNSYEDLLGKTIEL